MQQSMNGTWAAKICKYRWIKCSILDIPVPTYDFGSTTELTLKVISEREVPAKKKAIEILARNNLPLVSCDVCGKPATTTCTQCIYEDKGWLCDACAKDHECGEEMLWPMVNSPRAGVCGYTGQDPAYIW